MSIHDSVLSDRACLMCGNVHLNHRVPASERMYGTGEPFDYLQCAACGVLHLLDIPEEMGRYYPAHSYYSVHTRSRSLRTSMQALRDLLQERSPLLSRWIRRYLPNVALSAMTASAPSKTALILDVGCGDGALLRAMARLGYENLTGVDPLLETPSDTGCVRLVKGGLDVVKGRFDLISFHHSLEHIRDQVGVLRQAGERLTPSGTILLRIPTCESLAFSAYRANWVQLDAPRHLFLHSHRSIAHVAAQAGLAVRDLHCDSQPMQFWASDMYCAGVPLMSPVAKRYQRSNRRLYRDLSDWANAHRRGDQIVVTLGLDGC